MFRSGLPVAFIGSIARRSFVVWFGLRVMLLIIFRLTIPNVPAAMMIVVTVTAAVALDLRRRQEDLFLANLGVPLSALALAAAVPAILVEAAIQWLP